MGCSGRLTNSRGREHSRGESKMIGTMRAFASVGLLFLGISYSIVGRIMFEFGWRYLNDVSPYDWFLSLLGLCLFVHGMLHIIRSSLYCMGAFAAWKLKVK